MRPARHKAVVTLLLTATCVLLLASCSARQDPVAPSPPDAPGRPMHQGQSLLAQRDPAGWRGFRFDAPAGERSFTHTDKPALTRYIVDRILRERTPLSDPPRIDTAATWTTSVYTLALMPAPGGEEISLQLVSRSWPPEARAVFVREGDLWFEIPSDLLNSIYVIATNPNADMAVGPGHLELLGEYGWHIWYRLNSYQYCLPPGFVHRAGEFPDALFWAHRGALSGKVDLDLSRYLGKPVQIDVYHLDRDIPYLLPYGGTPRAVIVSRDGVIIGAWVDKGGDAAALNGERVAADEQFLVRLAEPSDPLDAELAAMGPADIVRAYWDAADAGDHRRAYACLTRSALFEYLFANMDRGRHANESFAHATSGMGLENYVSVKLVSLDPYSGPGVDTSEETRHFVAAVDNRLKEPGAIGDGRMSWYVSVARTPVGWRIVGMGTGL